MEKQIQQKLLEYLLATPKALAVLVASFYSGHLWVYLLAAYVRKSTKGNQLAQSVTGRISIGLIWFVGVLAPMYLIVFRDFRFVYENIMEIVFPTIVIGLFLQLAVAVAFIYSEKR